jgi:hypothetical protein
MVATQSGIATGLIEGLIQTGASTRPTSGYRLPHLRLRKLPSFSRVPAPGGGWLLTGSKPCKKAPERWHALLGLGALNSGGESGVSANALLARASANTIVSYGETLAYASISHNAHGPASPASSCHFERRSCHFGRAGWLVAWLVGDCGKPQKAPNIPRRICVKYLHICVKRRIFVPLEHCRNQCCKRHSLNARC